MKKILLLCVVCFQLVLIGAVKLDDSDNYIDSVVYIYPNKSKSGFPGQAEIQKVKFRELNKKDRETIDQNLDNYIEEYSNFAENNISVLQDDIFNSKSFRMEKPVYVKGKEDAIMRMPALNQGETNTCATFSSTAAVDILAGNGRDIYSNYKSLCLGHALSLNMLTPGSISLTFLNAINQYYPNPWDGSDGLLIFSQFKDFGLVKGRDENSQNGKFGKNEIKRPLDKENIKIFKKISGLNFKLFYINDINGSMKNIFPTKSKFVRTIKNEINKGNIVSIGVYIAIALENSFNGMTGNTNLFNSKAIFTDVEQSNIDAYNTWYLTTWLAQYIKKNKDNDNFVGAHQMIIIGYIDDIIDENNGVFILRNSWGCNGDNGNNYITYDYAYNLTDEIVSISVESDNTDKRKKNYL